MSMRTHHLAILSSMDHIITTRASTCDSECMWECARDRESDNRHDRERGPPDTGNLQSEYDAPGSVQNSKRQHIELKLATIVQYMCIGAGLLTVHYSCQYIYVQMALVS